MNEELGVRSDSGRNPARPDFKLRNKLAEHIDHEARLKKAPSLREGAITRRVTEGGIADRRSQKAKE